MRLRPSRRPFFLRDRNQSCSLDAGWARRGGVGGWMGGRVSGRKEGGEYRGREEVCSQLYLLHRNLFHVNDNKFDMLQ